MCFVGGNVCDISLPFFFIFLVYDGKSVKHYRIKQLDSGEYFVTRRKVFHSLNAFVRHYSESSDGLCIKLGRPSIKVEPMQCATPFKLYRIFWLLRR